MDSSIPLVELDAETYFFLLGTFGPSVVLGLDDPFRGWLAHEVRAARERAVRSLLDRNLARVDPTEGLVLSPYLGRILRVCAEARHDLIVSVESAEGHFRKVVHFGRGAIVEQWGYRPDRFRLTPVPDRTTLVARLLRLLSLGQRVKAEGEPFRVSEGRLVAARAACAEGASEAAAGTLRECGLGQESERRLLHALVQPRLSASFVLLAHRGDAELRHVRGFALLGGSNHLWVLDRESEAGEVRFLPADAPMVRARVRGMLP
jgi:hypothetical protein